jgi:hypothetical protein
MRIRRINLFEGPGNPRMMVVAWGKAVADVKPPRDGTKPRQTLRRQCPTLFQLNEEHAAPS